MLTTRQRRSSAGSWGVRTVRLLPWLLLAVVLSARAASAASEDVIAAITQALQAPRPSDGVVTVQLAGPTAVWLVPATPVVVPAGVTVLVAGRGAVLAWPASTAAPSVTLQAGAKLVLSNLIIDVAQPGAMPASLLVGLQPWLAPFVSSAVQAPANTSAAVHLADVVVRLGECSPLRQYQQLVCSAVQAEGLWAMPQVRPGLVQFKSKSADARFEYLSNVTVTCSSTTVASSADANATLASFSASGWPTAPCLILSVSSATELQLALSAATNASTIPSAAVLVAQLTANITLTANTWNATSLYLPVTLAGPPGSMTESQFWGAELDLGGVSSFVVVDPVRGSLSITDLCLTNLALGPDSMYPQSLLLQAVWPVGFDRPSAPRTLLSVQNSQLVVPSDLYSYLSYWAGVQASNNATSSASWLQSNVYMQGYTVQGNASHRLTLAHGSGLGTAWFNTVVTDLPYRTPLLVAKTGVTDLVPGSPTIALDSVMPVFNASQLVSALLSAPKPYLILMYNTRLESSTVKAVSPNAPATITQPITLLGPPGRPVILGFNFVPSLLTVAVAQNARFTMQRLVLAGLGSAPEQGLLGNLTSMLWALNMPRTQPSVRLLGVSLYISEFEVLTMQQALALRLMGDNPAAPQVDPAVLGVIQATWKFSSNVYNLYANQTSFTFTAVAPPGIEGTDLVLTSNLMDANVSNAPGTSFAPKPPLELLLLAPGPVASPPQDGGGSEPLPSWVIAICVLGGVLTLTIVILLVWLYWGWRARQRRAQASRTEVMQDVSIKSEHVIVSVAGDATPSHSLAGDGLVHDSDGINDSGSIGVPTLLGHAALRLGSSPVPPSRSHSHGLPGSQRTAASTSPHMRTHSSTVSAGFAGTHAGTGTGSGHVGTAVGTSGTLHAGTGSGSQFQQRGTSIPGSATKRSHSNSTTELSRLALTGTGTSSSHSRHVGGSGTRTGPRVRGGTSPADSRDLTLKITDLQLNPDQYSEHVSLDGSHERDHGQGTRSVMFIRGSHDVYELERNTRSDGGERVRYTPQGPSMAVVMATTLAGGDKQQLEEVKEEGDGDTAEQPKANGAAARAGGASPHPLLEQGLAACDNEQEPADVVQQIITHRKDMQSTGEELIRNVEFQQVLGQGSFGVVYKGKWRSMTVAIKTMMFQDAGAAKRIRQRALTEAAISTLLTHDNIVNTYAHDLRPVKGSDMPDDVHMVHWKLYIFQEFCDGGSLAQAVDRGMFQDQNSGCNNMMAILQVAFDIARGMEYIHAANVIHGDLSSANIMLRFEPRAASCFQAKVGDFGLSRFLEGPDHSHISNARQGTPFYIAPELMSHGIISKDADVFSFGVLLWEMFCGRPPWRDPDLSNFRSTLDPSTFPYHVPISCPVEYHALIMACLNEQAKQRPSFSDLVRDIGNLLRLLKNALGARMNHRRVQQHSQEHPVIQQQQEAVEGSMQRQGQPAGPFTQQPQQWQATAPIQVPAASPAPPALDPQYADTRMRGAAAVAAAAAAAAASRSPAEVSTALVSVSSPASAMPSAVLPAVIIEGET